MMNDVTFEKLLNSTLVFLFLNINNTTGEFFHGARLSMKTTATEIQKSKNEKLELEQMKSNYGITRNCFCGSSKF